MTPIKRQPERNPFTAFLGPGRRRTDHPLVVGFIVLCLAFIAVTGAVSAVVNLSTSNRIDRHLTKGEESVQESIRVRASVIRALEENNRALRRLCLISAKTKVEAQACSPSPEPLPGLVPSVAPEKR